MKKKSYLISFLSLVPTLLMAIAQQDLKTESCLTVLTAGAEPAAKEAFPREEGGIVYRFGSHEEELSVWFPVASAGQLFEVQATPEHKIVMHVDTPAIYLCSVSQLKPGQYEQAKQEIMDEAAMEVGDIVIDEVQIKENEGSICRSQTVMVMCKDPTSCQGTMMVRQQLILTSTHLFTLMVSNSLDAMQRDSAKAERFLNCWKLRQDAL